MEGNDYEPSGLAHFLHSFPHLDLTFQSVDSTFQPGMYRYKESLLFWAIVPIVWMLVTLLVIVMYFCYRCCQRDEKKATHLLKWTIAILSLLSCCAVGAGFYGNEETHKGLQRFLDAAQDIQETKNRTNVQVIGVEKNLNETVLMGIGELQRLIERNNSKYSTISRHLGQARTAAERVIANALNMSSKVNTVDFHYLDGLARAYGFHRWLVMVLLLSWLMVLFVILLFAIGKASKLIMLIFGILSLVSLILCWLSAGFHLGVSVGLGDFCTAPDVFFEQQGSGQTDKDIIRYYIDCNPRDLSNPFKMAFPNTYDSIKDANNSFRNAISILKGSVYPTDASAREDLNSKTVRVNEGLDEAIQTLIHLNALVECTNLHKSYIDAIKGICLHGLNGLVFLMVSIMLAGLFFTGLILLASGSWKSLTRGRDKSPNLKAYAGASEDDGPFLLQPESSTPSYYSFLPGCRAPLGEQMPLRKHVTPPPPLENHTMPPGYSGAEANHQNVNIAHLHDGSL